MLCETHVIDIGGGDGVLRHGDGLRPEAEVVDAVRTFSHGEETLAVGTLDTYNEQVLAVKLYGSAVERGVHHDALLQVGVVLLVEVIAPFQRSVLGCEDWILIACVDAVSPFLCDVLTA